MGMLDDRFAPDVEALLAQLQRRHGGEQIFLFGASGDPFWAARTPVEEAEIEELNQALTLLQQLEEKRPKPFFAYTPKRDLLVAALDSTVDLYIVVLAAGPDREAAEARVALIREELAPHAKALRELLVRTSHRPPTE